MRMMYRIAVTLACMLATVVLSGNGANYDFSRPSFDPTPWVSAFSPDRQTVMESVVDQYFDQDWMNLSKYTAEYDDQGRLSAQKIHLWDADALTWNHIYTMAAVYRPDNHLQRVDMIGLVDGEWQATGVMDYLYSDNLLRSIRYDVFTEQGREPWMQWALYYLPSTLLLEKVVEIYYFNGPAPGTIRRHEYTWDAGSRPAEIIESQMSEMGDWTSVARYTYVYHNDDQTTHAGYMKMLEFGWPFMTRFVSGVQPSKLLEQRRYDQSYVNGNWIETSRLFHVYDDANRLQRIDIYSQESPNLWEVDMQQTYDYNDDGLPIIETWLVDRDGNDLLVPDGRLVYGYAQITDADDPLVPPLLSHLRVFPNPFKPQTGISYKLQSPAQTEISVYNLKGQKVRVLHQGADLAGEHNLNWDGKDDQGRGLSAGIYLIRLNAGKQSATVKAVLAK